MLVVVCQDIDDEVTELESQQPIYLSAMGYDDPLQPVGGTQDLQGIINSQTGVWWKMWNFRNVLNAFPWSIFLLTACSVILFLEET